MPPSAMNWIKITDQSEIKYPCWVMAMDHQVSLWRNAFDRLSEPFRDTATHYSPIIRPEPINPIEEAYKCWLRETEAIETSMFDAFKAGVASERERNKQAAQVRVYSKSAMP